MNRVALVGFGFMGRTHYGAWKKCRGAKVVAVCVTDLAHLTRKVKGNIRGVVDNSALPKSVRRYDSFENLLSDGGFDTVDLAVPTAMHPKMAVAALEAGYDVICEKPMALDVRACDRMVAAAKKANRRLLVAHCVRYFPAYAYLADAVRDGRFGKVVAADFTRFTPAPDWNNAGKAWFLDERRSGGAALDLHVHDADFIRFVFGMPPAVASRGHVRKDGVTDHLSTAYLYADKVVTSDTSWAGAGSLVFDAAFRVFFERATVYFGGAYKRELTVYPAKGKPFAPKVAKGTGYEREIRAFNAVLCGKVPLSAAVSAEDARASVALVLAERRSFRSGRIVRV